MYSVPPSNSFVSMVLRLSRERGAATFSRAASQASIALVIRADRRFARPSVGSRARMLPGAQLIQPSAALMKVCVLNSWEATIAMTREVGCDGDRACRMRRA